MNTKLLDRIQNNEKIAIPIISVLLGIVSGLIILLVSGYNPLNFFTAIIRGTLGLNFSSYSKVFNSRYIGEYLVTVAPLCLTGLAVGFSFRTGLFNIGAEGQLMMGAFAAISVGLLLPPMPKIIMLPLVIASSVLAGAFWGFIPGILKALFNVHEVVVTIMLNYTAFYLTNFGYQQLPLVSRVKTESLPPSATLQSDFLSQITNNSRLHWGLLLVIISVIIYWIIMEKTTLGFELKSTGFNKYAGLYSGINVNKNITLALIISGAFAGLAGSIIAVGTFNYGRVLTGFENYGFDGIAIALVGNNSGIGILLSSILFGALQSAEPIMQTSHIPKDIISIIMSLIILFVAMQYGIKHLIRILQEKKHTKGPSS